METKTELQRFYTQEAAKSVLKTKIQYAEEGEKSTRYFYSLERQKQSKQTINVLTKMNLDTITKPHDIITESYNFYKSLYTDQPTDPHQQTDFLSIETPTLTTHDQNLCEGYVTEHELQLALQTMENNKSPGLDGLSTNFYKHFWSLLRTKLTHIYSYAYEQGHLSLSQQCGVITLLLKKGDGTKLQNWCPITLLNTDYKILTKALSNRLKQVLPSIIHTDQTACIPGRTINDNLRLIQDIITYANETNKPLALSLKTNSKPMTVSHITFSSRL